MTRIERAVAFVLGVIVCSLLSCSLSLIARENDVILSRGHTVTAHMSEESSSLPNQTSQTAETGDTKRRPYGTAYHDAAQRRNPVQKPCNLSSSEEAHVGKVFNSPGIWQSFQKQFGFRTGQYRPNEGFGEFLGNWLAKFCNIFALTRKVTRSSLIGSDEENSFERSSAQNHAAPNLMTHSAMKLYQEMSPSRFRTDDRFPPKQMGVGDLMTAVLGGIAGMAACALIATGVFRLGAVEVDGEGAVRRTLFEGQLRGEDSVSRGIGDGSHVIVPEEAV